MATWTHIGSFWRIDFDPTALTSLPLGSSAGAPVGRAAPDARAPSEFVRPIPLRALLAA